jgi:membrane-associated protein
MEFFKELFDILLHTDEHLRELIENHGNWTYLVLFGIVFCETGLVVTPFLPGDSLLFACGAFAALEMLNIWAVMGLLATAAILGDTVNYWIGHRLRGAVASGKRIRFVKPKHLEKAKQFYEKHGGKAIVLARFVPIVRTFVPFVAGVGVMEYRRFMIYNVTGAVLWVLVCVGAGYLFGNLPFVRDNFEIVVLGIIAVSVMPIVVEAVKEWRARRAARVKTAAGA